MSNMLAAEWKKDQIYTLADPAPWNPGELMQAADVADPRAVAAYYVWSVTRMTDSREDGLAMLKYLFADLEPFGRGFKEGGVNGGWDNYFNERLKDPEYFWLPRAYFEGADAQNGYKPARPFRLELYYNGPNTDTINRQSLDALGRLNIVYWVKSHAAGCQVNITVSKFEGSDRWYVTSGTSASGLFYDQRSAAGVSLAKQQTADDSTQEEHRAKYGG
ncbi:MAG: hypothetical protein IJP92_15035 [Lachnospiraceae bacterium]|nr:hypothetical protein [Lachnospiraceae bacterium]